MGLKRALKTFLYSNEPWTHLTVEQKESWLQKHNLKARVLARWEIIKRLLFTMHGKYFWGTQVYRVWSTLVLICQVLVFCEILIERWDIQMLSGFPDLPHEREQQQRFIPGWYSDMQCLEIVFIAVGLAHSLSHQILIIAVHTQFDEAWTVLFFL